MKIINVGDKYEVYPSMIQTMDVLPNGTFRIVFSPMAGFSLVRVPNLVVPEEKTYGGYDKKQEKVIRRYLNTDRNLGIFLSGERGMGKTLFAKKLSGAMRELGYPTIIVDSPYVGVADFIASIDQECMVLFDEFEKMFNTTSREDRDTESQETLLTLFDGTYTGKKMFVATANKIEDVNPNILDRPGRFHFHILFGLPNFEDTKAYLDDNVLPVYSSEIDNVLRHTAFSPLNYDCLRAVVTELNFGESFKETLEDLNIEKETFHLFKYAIILQDGTVINGGGQFPPPGRSLYIDGYNDELERWISLSIPNQGYKVEDGSIIYDSFEPIKIVIEGDNTRKTEACMKAEELPVVKVVLKTVASGK